MEEPNEVFEGEGAGGFGGEVAELGEVAGGFDDVGGFVAFAAVGDGGEVGTVGFEEEAVEGDEGCGVPDVLRLGVAEVSGEGEDEAKIERGLGLGEVSGEAMHDSGEAGGSPVLAEDGEEVIPGIGAVLAGAAVDEDGKFDGGGELELLAEDALLHLSRRVVVMVVESDFSDGDDLRVMGEALHEFEVGGGEQARFVRVDADGGVDPEVLLGEGDGAGEVVGAVSVANGEQSSDAGVVGALDDRFAIGGELGAVEMGVGVEEHIPEMTSQRRREKQLCGIASHLSAERAKGFRNQLLIEKLGLHGRFERGGGLHFVQNDTIETNATTKAKAWLGGRYFFPP